MFHDMIDIAWATTLEGERTEDLWDVLKNV